MPLFLFKTLDHETGAEGPVLCAADSLETARRLVEDSVTKILEVYDGPVMIERLLRIEYDGVMLGIGI